MWTDNDTSPSGIGIVGLTSHLTHYTLYAFILQPWSLSTIMLLWHSFLLLLLLLLLYVISGTILLVRRPNQLTVSDLRHLRSATADRSKGSDNNRPTELCRQWPDRMEQSASISASTWQQLIAGFRHQLKTYLFTWTLATVDWRCCDWLVIVAPDINVFN